MMVLGFAEYQTQASALAAQLSLPYATISVHHFPDGESQLTLPSPLPEQLIICRSLNQPNDKLIELLLTAGSARRHGVKKLILVAPYLCYMRQDKAFHQGEVVSQQIIGKLLADAFDQVLTVDAHLHRIANLQQAIPTQQAINITATAPMAAFIQQTLAKPLLIGPDSESEQWVSAIAAHQHLDYAIASKQRLGDKHVEVTLPEANYTGRDIVLVDDMASTGHTLLEAAKKIQAFAPASISVLVTHALFINHADADLNNAGIDHIWSCDSVPHPSNCITLAPLLAEQLSVMLAHL